MEGSLSPPGPITRLANRRSSSTGRASRSEGRAAVRVSGTESLARCVATVAPALLPYVVFPVATAAPGCGVVLAASNASTRRSNCSSRSRIPATVGLLSPVCNLSRYCLRAATMMSDGVTWSRDAASKSWECSSGGIRAPTMGETIVMMFAVDNSPQILPCPHGGFTFATTTWMDPWP